MRKTILAAALVTMLFNAARITEAGEITYSIQNYPSDQQGATLSGTITTDGVVGNLAATDVLSWSWTITPLGGTSFTLSSSDAGTEVFLQGSIVASPSSITIAAPTPSPTGAANSNAFALSTNPGGSVTAFLEYERPAAIGLSYTGVTPLGGLIWGAENPTMGGLDPWVIATAGSVPEPTSLTLLALGATCGIAFGLARKRGVKSGDGANDRVPS
jgi:PEP-CTERM motif